MNRSAVLSHISSHTLFNILANLFRVLVSGFVLIYIARVLGPSEYGIVSLVLSVAAIAGLFFDFGISTSTARFLAESDSPNSSIYLNGRFLNMLFAIIFSVVLFVLSKPIARVVNIGHPIYIQLICFLTFFTAIFRFSSRSLQGIKKTDKVALLNFVESLLANILLFAVVYYGYRAKGVIIGHTIPWLIAWIVSLFILQKYLKVFAVEFNKKMLKDIFYYALPLLLTSGSYFLLLRGPLVLLSVFFSTKEVSYLSIPMRMVELVSLPAYSLSVVATPFFTKQKQFEHNLLWLYVKIIKYYLIFYLPIAVFLALASSRLIQVVFGADYAKAIPVLFILSLYLPFFAITHFSGTTLDFLGRARQKSFVFAFTTAITITCAFFLIPRMKEIGAALVIAVPYALFSMYTILKSSSECGVILSKYLLKLVGLLFICLISGLSAVLILHCLAGLLGLIVSFLCFSILIFVLGTSFGIFKVKEFFSLFRMLR